MRTSIPRNPIITYLRSLLQSGETTKEKICVACELRYSTFDNIFFRDLVSPNIRKSLLYSGVMPRKIYDAYDQWFREIYRPAKKTSSRSSHKPAREDRGLAEASS